MIQVGDKVRTVILQKEGVVTKVSPNGERARVSFQGLRKGRREKTYSVRMLERVEK